MRKEKIKVNKEAIELYMNTAVLGKMWEGFYNELERRRTKHK